MATIEFNYQLAGLEVPLRAFAKRLTSDPTQAQELYNTTVERALQKQDKFRDELHLETWLMTIMRNICASTYCKAAKRAPLSPITETSKYEQPRKAPQSINYAGLMQDMQEIVSGLPAPIDHVFILHYYGYSKEAIAARLKLSSQSVQEHITSARKQLKISCAQKRENL